jgi:protein phosphatase 1 regulatory subunit 7
LNQDQVISIPSQVTDHVPIFANLKMLEISSNKIKLIPKFDHEKLPKLQELFINKNRIENIENLSLLHNLRVLGLTCNSIQKIQNLQGLNSLEELYIAENYIEEMENFNDLPKLAILDLSFNKISKVKSKDLEHITDLWVSKTRND